jgi:hypothetical protein
MFDWLGRLQKAIENRNEENAHRQYLENRRRNQQHVHEEIGFAQAFKQYMSNRYEIDVDQALQDCGDHAEDWDDNVSERFREWKAGGFDEVEEAFEDLWAEIETMLEWEGQRHNYPPTERG